jgi:hypothetical protein
MDKEGETVSRENIPSVFRLRGHVNVAALQDALAYLIERQEVLRAKYVLRHGEVLQVCTKSGHSRRPGLVIVLCWLHQDVLVFGSARLMPSSE